MKVIEADEVERALDFPSLVAALRSAFAGPAGTPRRTVYALAENDPFHDAFAVLPAWNDEIIGVKAFTYLPSNVPHGRQILHSKVLLFDRRTGAATALVDGTQVTYWRTAAVAALAADYLARRDAKRLLFCGTGNLAPYMILAHASVRSYERIAVWGRHSEKVARTIELVKAGNPRLHCVPAANLEAEVRGADVISCATGSKQALFDSRWVKPGTHADFFGNHEKAARECDSDLIASSRVYVDSRANCLNEAGEILIPIAEGRITEAHVLAELAELCSGRIAGRRNAQEITVFKSVGTALSDLAAASLVTRKVSRT
jgi:1-pyrroline-2-carboxylate reductase [NAD(P)H]